METLTTDQQLVFDIIENTNDNVLVHGKPGVGKTVLSRALREFGQKFYHFAAPTGLAAINMGGAAKTLHSLFMIPISNGIMPPDFNKFTNNPNVLNHLKHAVKHLVIDEISMVRCDTLDYIDRLLSFAKQNNEPFGGVQVIAVGDFFQLPPIVNKEDRKSLEQAGYKSEFAFDAKCFKNFRPLILDEVLRQKGDDKFISILHSARTGDIGIKDLTVLNQRVEKCSDIRIILASKNATADDINQRQLAKIDAPVKEFHANSYGTWPAFPAETILKLKVGAQVLIKKNAADRPPRQSGKFESVVVNGSLGVVAEMPEPNEDGTTSVKVELRDGSIVTIYTARWEQKVKEKVGDVWTERVVASFEQIPLQLAWAISIHKSQGQSFEFVHVDPASMFAAGQLYVALSRARSLNGLSLERKMFVDLKTKKCKSFWANDTVIEFVKRIEQESRAQIKKAI